MTAPSRHAQQPALARLLLAFLAVMIVLLAGTAASRAQATPDIKEIVRNASYNELRASNRGETFRYRKHSIDDGKDTLREIVETKDGDMYRLLEVNGKPLSEEAQAKDIARLNALKSDPAAQASKHKASQKDGERDNEMLKVLPDAFLFTYLGMVPGPNGPCYRLGFAPNPAFQPPSRDAEVYHGMTGELWVDQEQQRMVKFDAHLISDVNFGWGFVGKLYQGGTILVDQKDVGDHHWETTHMALHLTGKILLVKSLNIQSTEDSFDFAPVPDSGYQAAIAMLEAMPAH